MCQRIWKKYENLFGNIGSQQIPGGISRGCRNANKHTYKYTYRCGKEPTRESRSKRNAQSAEMVVREGSPCAVL